MSMESGDHIQREVWPTRMPYPVVKGPILTGRWLDLLFVRVNSVPVGSAEAPSFRRLFRGVSSGFQFDPHRNDRDCG